MSEARRPPGTDHETAVAESTGQDTGDTGARPNGRPSNGKAPAAAADEGAGTGTGTASAAGGRTRGPAEAERIHNRISVLRAERGISRRRLAEALGVHYQTVGYLERGEYNPSLHLALRIAEYFEVPVEVLFSINPFPRIGG